MPRARKAGRADQYELPEFIEMRERVAENVRRLRDDRGWSQLEASEHCDMLVQHYFRIEAGALNLTLTSLARIAHGFRIDPLTLLRPRGTATVEDALPARRAAFAPFADTSDKFVRDAIANLSSLSDQTVSVEGWTRSLIALVDDLRRGIVPLSEQPRRLK